MKIALGMDMADALAKKVLVVDDDLDLVDLYTELLTSAGYQVLVANAGWEALVTLQNVRPALVILDLCLPGIDGFEVCREVTRGSLSADVPVIVVSALTDEKSKNYVRSLGVEHYIEKPFVPSELVQKIEDVLKKSRMF